jgi:DNA-directed RNA polymerase I subunit RPA2
MPDGSGPRSAGPSARLSNKGTFRTLEREASFRTPTRKGATVPILNEFVAPALESFNALFDDSGLPAGDTDGKGLLTTGLHDIGERVVFDGHGSIGEESGQTGWGNRLRSAWTVALLRLDADCDQVWIEQVSIGRPMVPEKDKTARERRVFPSEVRNEI